MQLEYKDKFADKDTINHNLIEINITLKNKVSSLEKALAKMQDIEVLNNTLNKQLIGVQKSLEDTSKQNSFLQSQIDTLKQNQQEALKNTTLLL